MDRFAGVKPAGRRRRRLLPAEKRRKERKRTRARDGEGWTGHGTGAREKKREKRRGKKKDRGSISLSASGRWPSLPLPLSLLTLVDRSPSSVPAPHEFPTGGPYNLPHDFLPSVTRFVRTCRFERDADQRSPRFLTRTMLRVMAVSFRNSSVSLRKWLR